MEVPWVHSFQDLKGIGVVVSDEQRHVVEEGGEVLVIQRLPALDYCGCGDDHGVAQPDPNGSPLMLPMVFHAVPPFSPFEAGWKGKPETCAHYLEAEDGDGWRRFPSYIGSSHTTVLDHWYDERLRPIRVWQGIPLLNDADRALAELLITGFRSWVYDSKYEEMAHLMELEKHNGEEFDLDDPEDENYEQYWTLRAMLAEHGYIRNLPNSDQWDDGRPLDFDPIEHHVLNPDARRLWRVLVMQSQRAAFRILEVVRPQNRTAFVHSERMDEPWY